MFIDCRGHADCNEQKIPLFWLSRLWRFNVEKFDFFFLSHHLQWTVVFNNCANDYGCMTTMITVLTSLVFARPLAVVAPTFHRCDIRWCWCRPVHTLTFTARYTVVAMTMSIGENNAAEFAVDSISV